MSNTTPTDAQNKLHDFLSTGTKALHHLYVVGQAIKNDKCMADVDKESDLYEWEKDLIKLLIMIKPFLNMMIDYFPVLKQLIDWASSSYDTFAMAGKIAGI